MAAPRLVLASRSPQRRAVLAQLGVQFEALAPDVEELAAGEARSVAVANALRKARAVADRAGDRPVLGVDTLVALDGRLHGKPPDREAARATLAALAGRTHEVWSGLALLAPAPAPERTAAAVTSVTFRALEPAELDWYLTTDEWRERAGAYAIQGRGAALVERIAGDYFNVVGLPVAALVSLLPELSRA